MNRWKEKLVAFNTEWNDLPRRLMWIIVLLLCFFLVLVAFPYVAPFVVAALFAWIINPAVDFLTRLLGGRKITRNIVSAVLVVLLTTLITTILLVLMGRLFEEVKALAVAMPGWVGNASTSIINWINELDLDWSFLENGVEEALLGLLAEATSMLTSLASRIASIVARGAWQVVGFLPQGVLFVVLTLMGTFYMSSDKERIFGYLRSLLPEKHRERSNLFRASILRAILSQFRAALVMLVITFTELTVGFLAMGLDYAVLFAATIAVMDALPVIGAGMFLIPMCIYGLVVGNLTLGIGSGLIYLTTIIVRQLMEPRLIGRQLGLYPLATMMAMYAGLRAVGFIGMLIGPVMLLLCKVALTADKGRAEAAAGTKPLLPFLQNKKKKG